MSPKIKEIPALDKSMIDLHDRYLREIKKLKAQLKIKKMQFEMVNNGIKEHGYVLVD